MYRGGFCKKFLQKFSRGHVLSTKNFYKNFQGAMSFLQKDSRNCKKGGGAISSEIA